MALSAVSEIRDAPLPGRLAVCPRPDVVAVHTAGRHPGRIARQIADAGRGGGWRPPVYAQCGEAVPVGANRGNVDCPFSLAPADRHNRQHPCQHRNPRYAAYAAGPTDALDGHARRQAAALVRRAGLR